MNIVSIGGGTGQFSLLTGLREYVDAYNLQIKAIVTTLDNGGSSGKLITQYGVLPPGDVRNCLIALSKEPEILIKLFKYRFDEQLDRHSFGNLFITALNNITGSFEKAVNITSEILKIKGEVIPVSLTPNNLIAKLSTDKVIVGEHLIDTLENKTIQKLFLEKPTPPNPRALEALKNADLIILGPGDLYSSILPNILFPDMKKVIAQNKKALKVLITPIMTKPGETDKFGVKKYREEIENYLESSLTHILVNSKEPFADALEKYAKENKFPLKDDVEDFDNIEIVRADFIDKHNIARHNPHKLARVILREFQS